MTWSQRARSGLLDLETAVKARSANQLGNLRSRSSGSASGSIAAGLSLRTDTWIGSATLAIQRWDAVIYGDIFDAINGAREQGSQDIVLVAITNIEAPMNVAS